MECLLEITFQCSQHKIDFGRVFGWILGGFGLHFGRFFGFRSDKVGFQSGLKSTYIYIYIDRYIDRYRRPRDLRWLSVKPTTPMLFPGAGGVLFYMQGVGPR